MTRGWWILTAVNGVATATVMVFSVLLLVDPAVGLPEGVSVTAGVESYAQASAVRSLTLATVVLYLLAIRSRARLAVLLVVTGLTQTGDGIIHAVSGNPTMVIGAAALAIIPFVSTWWLTKATKPSDSDANGLCAGQCDRVSQCRCPVVTCCGGSST